MDRSAPADPPEPSDDDLVARSRHGDTAAFDQLFVRYQRRIYSLAYNMTSSREDALHLLIG